MNPHNQQIQQRFYITRQQLLNPMNGSIAGPPVYLTRTPYTIEYNVNVFPNGRSPAEAGRFLVFLQFKFPENLQIVANYHFIIGPKVQNFHHTYKSSSSFGGIICSRQQLFHPVNVLNGEKLFIELMGTVSVQRLSVNPRLLSVRANMNRSALSSPSFSNSPKPKPDLSYRMPIPPSIIYKEKSSVETPKSETEINIARILQNHLEEERRTPKTAETPKKTEKKVVAEKEAPKTSTNDAPRILTNDAVKTSTNDENVTPRTPGISVIEIAVPEAAAAVHETNAIEQTSDIHEPPPRSPEPHPNSETDKSDSQPNDSSSSATTDEPSRNKRVRTRTSRYVEFVVEEDDLVEEPVTKKSRKRKSNISPNSNLDGNDEYIPPRRSKSVARKNTTAETIEPKFTCDCKIEGIEKTFDVNKKMLSQKSKGFAALFEANNDSIIELEGIPDRTLEAAFNFCHGLPLKDMNNRECFSLLFFAYTFEMPELKIILEERLLKKIALTNACDIANAAIMAKSEKLRNDCKKYFIENLRNNATLRNYVSLNKELKDEVLAAVGSPN